jgi:hypothetical protein
LASLTFVVNQSSTEFPLLTIFLRALNTPVGINSFRLFLG